jgi:hypothetical protein
MSVNIKQCYLCDVHEKQEPSRIEEIMTDFEIGKWILRSSVNDCLDYFSKKYHEKPEGILIQEIRTNLECLK